MVFRIPKVNQRAVSLDRQRVRPWIAATRWAFHPHTAIPRRRLLPLLPGLWLLVGQVASTTEPPSRRVDVEAAMASDICVTKKPGAEASATRFQNGR